MSKKTSKTIVSFTLENTEPGNRFGFKAVTYNAKGAVVETVEKDYSSDSSRRRASRKMLGMLTESGYVNKARSRSRLRPERISTTGTLVDAKIVGAEASAKAEKETDYTVRCDTVCDNPAKIANPVIDSIPNVVMCDAIAAVETGRKNRTGILARIAKRRAGLERVASLEATYSSDTNGTATETSEAEPVTKADDTAAAEAYEVEMAAAKVARKAVKAAKAATSKRDQHVLDMAEVLDGLVKDGETVVIPFDGRKVVGHEVFPKGATYSWYWRTMPGVAAAREVGVTVAYDVTSITVSRDLSSLLSAAKAEVARIEAMISEAPKAEAPKKAKKANGKKVKATKKASRKAKASALTATTLADSMFG
jgi:hypothetical protein